MSRFLQHFLPKRFMRVRYYGFLSPRKRHLLEDIKELFGLCKPENGKSMSDLACEFAATLRTISCQIAGQARILAAK